jgi:ketosteroid isomerase-like protein
MKNKLVLLMTAMIFLSVTSCTEEEERHEVPDINAIKIELQAMENAYAVAENAKNAQAVVAYYADDAQSLPADEPTVVGKAAILDRMVREFANDSSNTTISFEAVDVFAAGNLAIETGKSISLDADGKQVSSGKYMSLFEKRNGKYVCIRDIWNRDAAPDKE